MNKVDHFLKNNIGLNNLLNNNIPGLNKNHVCRAIKLYCSTKNIKFTINLGLLVSTPFLSVKVPF